LMLPGPAVIPTRDEARKELARRKTAQSDLIRFGQYVMPGFRPFRHQKFLADKLRLVERYVETGGKEGIGNLLVMMQPQIGKSTTISHLFPAYILGRHVDWPFIMTSYNDQKASSNSRMVRELIDSKNYRPLFGDLANGVPMPVELSSDSRAVTEWRLAGARGGVVAAGVGGGITGYPSRITIIDDPFKNREEADSVNRQELVWDWLETSVQSRRQEGSALIVFNTRWAIGDIAGRIIQQMAVNDKSPRWDIVFMPALALNEDEYPKDANAQRERMADEGVFLPLADQLGRKPGESVCPELISREMLELIRDTTSPYNWMSLYQQIPVMRSGGMFRREFFTNIVEKVPDDIRFVRSIWYWDKAARQGTGDWTGGILMAVDQHGRVWVLMMVRGQWSTYERHEQMRRAYEIGQQRFAEKFTVPPQLWHQQDPAAAGLDSARATNIALAGLPAHFEPVSGDKEVRADPWSSALEASNVVFLRGAWNQPFFEEHLSFPKGKNDDQVDCSSSAYTKLMVRRIQRPAKSYSG
jgi:predicted phage terminase large subunit-like protein